MIINELPSYKYAANHIYSNIGQVPYPFSPYFCIVNKPIEYMETKKTTREEYQKCVNAVVDYINLHLGEEIDLKSLAKISHFSPFYFHRIMKAFLGEPVGTFIVRTRTETAARLLRYTDLPIADIAYRIGYSSSSSLSKVFKQFYGISPLEYRNNKNFVIMKPAIIRPELKLKREIKVDIKKVALPSAQDVVEIKKTKIKDDLIEIVESESYRKYTEMAGEVLQNLDPEVALAALLKLAFKNELEESSYPEIRSINVDRKGTARLFISIGKMDGFDARKLTDMLKRECRLPDNKIDDVRGMDSYSFVTVPFSDARQAIRQLNDINRGGRPIAELAKDGDSGENKERSGRDFRKEKRKGARKEDRKTERRDAARKSGGNPRKNDFDWNNVQWDAVNPAAGWGGKAGFDKRAGGKKRGKR